MCRRKIKLNKKTLAYCLGDGHVGKNGNFSLKHCKEQKEYIEWKSQYFNKKPIYSKDSSTYQFSCGIFNRKYGGEEIRKKLYGVLGHKFLSKEIVNNIDDFCLAILYLDKGSLYEKKINGKIHAYELVISIYGRKSECNYLIKMLKDRYGLDFTLKFNKNRYSIRCSTCTARKFLEIIRPLVPNFNCFKDNKLKQI